MSQNQSRAEKSEGHSRRPGRSNNSGHNRGFYGGGRGGGGAPPSTNPPALSTSRSYKKSGNAQPRVTPAAAFPNGAHVPVSSRGSQDPVPSGGTKAPEEPVQRPSRALPKAPSSSSSQPLAVSSDSTVSSTPPKGDPSKPINLQFGSLSPGMMNGMQIPARTSSAPPNLDEQKHAQARHDSFRAMPTKPMPTDPRPQQQTRKDVGGHNQFNTGESHPPIQTKRDVYVPVSSTPTVTPPKPSVLPIGGMPMHMPFQQPQIPMQFGGPSPHMQPQGVAANSLQMTMAIPVVNGPQVPQQMFVPNFQSHPLQQQNLMHQGQSMGFAPQIGHQLPPQLSNMGFSIAPQFTQQGGKFGGPRKTTVKITHPETHEELRLDKRTDSHVDGGGSSQRPLSNVTAHSQAIPTFSSSHQINCYPPYNHSPMFFPVPNSHQLTSTQMTTGSQGQRYSYPVGQSGQISFLNTSVHNPVIGSKPGPPPTLHGVSEAANFDTLPVSAPSVPVQVTKPAATSSVQRSGLSSVRNSMVSSNMEAPKLLKTQGDASAFHQKKDGEIVPENITQHSKSVESPGNTSLSDADSAVAASALPQQKIEPGISAPFTSGVDSTPITETSKPEPIQRSDLLKDHEKKASKKDAKHTQQQNQVDTEDYVGFTKLSSKVVKDRSDLSAQEASVGSEKLQSLLGSDAPAAGIKMPSLTEEHASSAEARISEAVELEEMPAVSPSEVTVEKEASQASALGHYDPLEFSSTSKFSEGDALVMSTLLDPKLERSISKIPDSFSCVNEQKAAEPAEEENKLTVKKRETVEASTDLSHDNTNSVSYPVSSVKETSELVNSVPLVKQEDTVVYNLENANVYDVFDGVKVQSQTTKEAVDCILEVHAKSEEMDVTSVASSDIKDSVTNDSEAVTGQDVALSSSVSSETKQKLDGQVTQLLGGGTDSVVPSESKEKPMSEPARGARTNTVKKKKRKEILSKADAAGTSDLYNAYKGPEEKHEVANSLENSVTSSTVHTEHMLADVTDNDDVAGEEDGQSKAEIDDWEDAADISTPKLRSENGEQVHGNEATGKRRYSRDFMLTFADQCTDLPVGFEIGSDIADALMSIPVGTAHIFDRDPYPSPGRVTDRSPGASRVDHRMAAVADDDRWNKVASFGPGRDIRLDMGHGAANVNFRPGQVVNHGVLRNPRGQASGHFVGGILSGPLQSMASHGGMPRNNADADRWQRGTNIQRGLMPSPHMPSHTMHKAANKYEVGKVSDKEQAKQRQLKAILNKLTPQNFEKLFLQVKEVNVDNTVTLTGVISQIFDKALTEPTFCEMYANFCVHLSSELPDFNEDNEKITFKRLLLNKCQEEFERGEREQAEANRAEEEGEIKQTKEEREQKRIQARRRMLGNIRLIGELYKQRMLTEKIMHECIKKLLGEYQNPDEEDVEALCKLMSTIGEMIDHPRAKEHMDAYFDRILKLSTNQKLSSRVRFMLRDAIDLRKNKWQQRRKVDGPKKIDEVHRDAAQERQAQSSRLARGPVVTSTPRRVPSVDYGSRGSAVLSSPSSQKITGIRGAPGRGYAIQDARMDDRHQFESRVLPVPLHQRSTDESITLGPQGGLARGMSSRGQPLVSNAPSADISPNLGDPRRLASGPNSYVSMSREDSMPRYMQDKLSGVHYDQPSPYDRNSSTVNRDPRIADRVTDRSSATTVPGRIHGPASGILHAPSETKPLSEERLREKSISAIREFYSAKDEEEMALCIKELKSPSFYPTMISSWVTDSFERKDLERDLLASLLVNLCKSRNGPLSQIQLLHGFESVLETLEDAVNDAPRAAEFLGHMFAKIMLEDVVSLADIGRLVREGGEEPGSLIESGRASELLGNILQFVRTEKGDTVLCEIRTNSGLRLEEFRPHPNKSNKLDAFL